jgi:hypothetical protein
MYIAGRAGAAGHLPRAVESRLRCTVNWQHTHDRLHQPGLPEFDVNEWMTLGTVQDSALGVTNHHASAADSDFRWCRGQVASRLAWAASLAPAWQLGCLGHSVSATQPECPRAALSMQLRGRHSA